MFETLNRAPEIPADGLDSLPVEVVASGRPTVLRGAFRGWPLVRAALQSDEAAVEYLDRFYNGRLVSTIVAAPSEKGRFFYRPDSKDMNFQRSEQRLSIVLKALLQEQESDEPLAIAMQAVSVPDCLPGLERDNPNPFVPAGIGARVWIGNSVTVAPHFDVADNLACVAAGRRRFILFPPEQTANLYPGPMDVTPANVPISMVLLGEPDFERFPRYREALDSALVAELKPGDAIYIPYLWWHGVQSLEPFNVLVNYWWNREESSARYPFVSLLRLCDIAYRDMPVEHRGAWRALYDHYVFQLDGDPMEAISPPHRPSSQPVEPLQIAKLKEALRDLFG
jgi:Cupin-like domain